LFRGTVCKLRPVFGLQLALFVGVAVADVEVDVVAGVVLFVSWDGVQVAACVWLAAGAVCRRFGGGRGGGQLDGGGAVCPAGRCASCRMRGVGRAVSVGVGISAWVGASVLVAYMVVGSVAH